MSGASNLDLRFPIGGLFVTLGAILAGYGFLTADNAAMYERSTALNVNMWWGTIMFAFGLLFLWLAARAARVRPDG